jgi:UDP-3-O-[3-hydroxymyristoyl] glucosamine N-acyltransferase
MTTISDIINFFGNRKIKLSNDFNNDTLINGGKPIDAAGNTDITFCSSTAKNPKLLLSKTNAALIIVDDSILKKDIHDIHAGVQAVVYSPDARLDFVRVLTQFFLKPKHFGIHDTAVISSEAKIAPNVSIGPFSYVGACEIGEGSVIYGHAYIYDGNVTIGKNVSIHAGTVIGVDGFGYARNEDEELEQFPSTGGVIIEDNVDIHSQVNVDCGTLGNTVIGKGTKIDKFCHIGHNVTIGKHCVIAAHTMIAGSAKIGDYVWIAPCVSVRDEGVNIGNRAFIGMSSIITKNIPEKQIVMGCPARPIDEQKKLLREFTRLIADA